MENVKAKIHFVKRMKPNYVVWLHISGDGAGSGGSLLINPRTLELLMKSLGVKNLRDFKGNHTFDVDYFEFDVKKVLENFLRSHYPKERGLKISTYREREKKYNPYVWKIIRIKPNVRHLLLDREENYWAIRVESHPKGYMTPLTISTAFLKEEAFTLVMKYFEVERPKDLVGKEFRANFDDAQALLLSVAIKTMYPKFI
ncbi:hypothetical protein GYA37_00240 [candidate division WWE3 bacterium]|uniref:Uncharacterized protein n=1 Tax=candidate division WWE3 bacterium TaxID=2053526 RepID=A0A7X9E6B1_UNCKA|nr:hypothetical protein [candidate division WWE3 bacterium]